MTTTVTLSLFDPFSAQVNFRYGKTLEKNIFIFPACEGTFFN